VTTILLWSLSRWRPSLVFKWHAIKDLLGFSTNLLGTQLLNYWVRNLDYLLIGRLIGPQPLGVYKNAYQVMLFPLTNVSRVISKVMFPALSMIQQEKSRVRSIYLQMTRVIALVTFPMMAGLFVTVEPFVFTVFGSKWAGMIPLLRVFCITGMMQSIGTLNGNLYLSQGRADLQLRVSLFVKVTAVLGIVIGLHWGVLGVALGYAVASLINSYPAFHYAGRLVNLTYWRLWRNLSGVLGCSLAMAAAVWALGAVMPDAWPHWLCLSTLVVFGAIVYLMLIHFLRLAAYSELRRLVTEQYGVMRPGARLLEDRAEVEVCD
jgi:PST family polysaccharide transporter